MALAAGFYGHLGLDGPIVLASASTDATENASDIRSDLEAKGEAGETVQKSTDMEKGNKKEKAGWPSTAAEGGPVSARLVVRDVDEFVQMALLIARDSAVRATLRTRVESAMQQRPIFEDEGAVDEWAALLASV